MALFTSREADRLYCRFDKYTGRTYRWRVPNTHGLPRSWPTAGLLEGDMLQFCRNLWSDEQGQDIAEYAVMLAVILVIVIGTVRLIGTNANNVFNSVASSMSQ